MTTYGIKKHIEGVKNPRIYAAVGEFKASVHVGLGAYNAMVYKTRKGAQKEADRLGGEVFEIINDVMNY